MKCGSAEYLFVSSGKAAWINADDTSTVALSEHCVGRDSPKLLTEDTTAGGITNTKHTLYRLALLSVSPPQILYYHRKVETMSFSTQKFYVFDTTLMVQFSVLITNGRQMVVILHIHKITDRYAFNWFVKNT